ncbi:phosphonate C-P lyase system protein PhnL [Cytobacillus kochii]|uniref:phosphonate C-P lyase system protein PhnL n=1 Tax=Cytobacillus kochii TaxID=859143 RepID=UPI00203DAB01|nr:ATP-binding cassette domain-containing protein [Cytobacillus kochii]MCM3322350.1 ATP-binding cassette domain-containing protein [Cytobacillus kochii]MCM3345172.1 ATP-binding cassette domain-containing protein [Cytobacillus kochii]
MTFLKIEGLEKNFQIVHLGQTIHAVQQLNFSMNQGEFIGITGKSGSGKSTILKSIYRTYLPEAGRIYFDSEKYGWINLQKASEREIIYLRKYEIGYVSQFLNVMPRTTARELVEQSVLETGRSLLEAQKEAEEVLSHFELDRKLWDTYPNTFSGGEKLRLNIAIAAVKKPRLLLLDEPTASLDQQSKQKVKEVIQKLKESGTTLLGVFHDIEFMDELCDHIFEMSQQSFKRAGAAL